jgi:hypothetical protein
MAGTAQQVTQFTLLKMGSRSHRHSGKFIPARSF